jgi:hypothetical protein
VQGERQKSFYWNKATIPSTEVPRRNFSMAPSAKKAERKHGTPYYFACGAKKYMGIMDEVNILNIPEHYANAQTQNFKNNI